MLQITEQRLELCYSCESRQLMRLLKRKEQPWGSLHEFWLCPCGVSQGYVYIAPAVRRPRRRKRAA